MERYAIYRFSYVAAGHRLLRVFARSLETAEAIVAAENEGNPRPWRRRRLFFRKAVVTVIPPYEMEREQMDVARAHAERRRAKAR